MKRRHRPFEPLSTAASSAGGGRKNGPRLRELRAKMKSAPDKRTTRRQDFRQNVHEMFLNSCCRRAYGLGESLFRMHAPVKRHSVAAKFLGAVVIAPRPSFAT